MGKGLVGWIKGQWGGEGASAPLCSLTPVPNPSPSHPCSSPGPPQRCLGNTWQTGCRDAASENFPAIPAPAASAAATSSSSVAPCGRGPGCITGMCHRDHPTSLFLGLPGAHLVWRPWARPTRARSRSSFMVGAQGKCASDPGPAPYIPAPVFGRRPR